MRITSHGVVEMPNWDDIQQLDAVLIVGNGFDLNLGFKTGYTDFIKDENFKMLLKSENDLAKYLNNKNNLQNWIDIECELENYSKIKNPNASIFLNEYKV
ncbi:hypothetical protein KAH55_03300 [bacterium]|nr:hypothetical protein [bacterium]